MTERKPPGASWETWIEAQIRVAMEDGAFDKQQFSMRRARNGLVLWYAGARLTESDLQQVADLVVSSHRT
jgi:hypothetical protein